MTKVKFGLRLHGEDFDYLIRYAKQAEKLGFDSVWRADHIWIPFEPLTLITAVASKTRKLRVGTSVIDMNRRNPATLAHVTSTLDIISNGRLILGVGQGVWNHSCYGISNVGDEKGILASNKVSRAREAIICLKRFWTESNIDYNGKFFTFENASLAIKPIQKPHPPLWGTGFGPRTLKMVGEFADGFISQNMSPSSYQKVFTNVKNSAKKIGRDPSKIIGIFSAPMAISNDLDNALEIIQNFQLGLFPRKISIEEVYEKYIFGTPDDCIEKIENYMKAGVSYFICLPLLPFGYDSIKYWSKGVIDYFTN